MQNIALIYTDFHLQLSNLDSVKEIMKEAIQIANSKGVSTHIWLGDVFDSRISQRQELLNGLTSIIEMFDQADHRILAIPGNHDKTNYSSYNSFLDEYRYHPSFTLIDQLDFFSIKNISCYFIPFLEESLWMEEFKSGGNYKNTSKQVLFTHTAFDGSINNDGTKVECKIKPSLFKNFDAVASGHYHNYQEIGDNIFHLGSLQQNNFGEDDNKGFWLMNDKLEFHLIKPKSGQRFVKMSLDLDDVSKKQAEKLISKFEEENKGCRMRIEITGDSALVKAFESAPIKAKGIDIKRKYKEVEDTDVEINEEVEKVSLDDVKSKFQSFCKDKGYNYKEGIKILETVISNERAS